MGKKWMPFYVGDFLADTMHLSATATGIYVRLIFHAWQHGGTIPLDNEKLACIAGIDSRLWWKYRGTVLQFFDPVDASTARQKRVATELRRSAEISNKRKAAAMQMHMQKGSKPNRFAPVLHHGLHTQSQSHKESYFLTQSECPEQIPKLSGGSLATAPPEGALRSPPSAVPEGEVPEPPAKRPHELTAAEVIEARRKNKKPPTEGSPT